MQRLHRGLAQHFKQDPALPIRLYVHGHGTTITLQANGDMSKDHGDVIYPKDAKRMYMDKELATTEELIKWLEANTSILIRINNAPTIYNEQGSPV